MNRWDRYNELYHHGILGQKWGIRRYQNEDGSLTEEGKKRYYNKHDNVANEQKYIKDTYEQAKKDTTRENLGTAGMAAKAGAVTAISGGIIGRTLVDSLATYKTALAAKEAFALSQIAFNNKSAAIAAGAAKFGASMVPKMLATGSLTNPIVATAAGAIAVGGILAVGGGYLVNKAIESSSNAIISREKGYSNTSDQITSNAAEKATKSKVMSDDYATNKKKIQEHEYYMKEIRKAANSDSGTWSSRKYGW